MHDILLQNSIEKRLKKHRVQSAPRSSRKKRSVGKHTTFWEVGGTLGISFFGHPVEDLKQAIFAVAQEWLVHANLDFELIDDDDQTADIRIDTAVPHFVNEGLLGTDARYIDGPSMNLGVRPAEVDFRSVVLHEFGHALGMEHEHQHPMANIPWDFDTLRAQLAEHYVQEATSDEELEAMIEETIKSNYLPTKAQDVVTLDYDPSSIMHYPIRQELTLGDWQLPGNDELSAKDKQFMRMAYPGREKIEE